MRETLRASKQRHRVSIRIEKRQRNGNPLRRMWNDHENEENEEIQNVEEQDTENNEN